MIYVILLCVIGFYMKLCVDLIIGASRVSQNSSTFLRHTNLVVAWKTNFFLFTSE